MPFYFWSFFGLLSVCTLVITQDRHVALSRLQEDWWIDIANLVIHLWGLPLLQSLVLLNLYDWATPAYRGSVSSGFATSLLLYVLLDYLWYWNHRLLHSYTWVWNLHAVHHSAKQVDVFTTARNSVWSHFAEVYVWYISIAAFVLRDPSWFIGFVIVGSMLNFWTHTRYSFSRESRLYRSLSLVFILPQEHLWHHSASHSNTNFGTVFSLWDRLHRTRYAPMQLPESYGSDYIPGAFRQLLLPIKASLQMPSIKVKASVAKY